MLFLYRCCISDIPCKWLPGLNEWPPNMNGPKCSPSSDHHGTLQRATVLFHGRLTLLHVHPKVTSVLKNKTPGHGPVSIEKGNHDVHVVC